MWGRVSCFPPLPGCLDMQGFSARCEREHLLFGIIIFMAFLTEVFSGWRLDWHCDPRFAVMIKLSCCISLGWPVETSFWWVNWEHPLLHLLSKSLSIHQSIHSTIFQLPYPGHCPSSAGGVAQHPLPVVVFIFTTQRLWLLVSSWKSSNGKFRGVALWLTS